MEIGEMSEKSHSLLHKAAQRLFCVDKACDIQICSGGEAVRLVECPSKAIFEELSVIRN